MWEKIRKIFETSPSRLKVVELFLDLGIRVDEEGFWCGPIALSVTKIAKSVGVDRKVIIATAETIQKNDEIAQVFKRLKPVSDISDVARYDKESFEGVIEIYAFSNSVGIAALVTNLLAEEGISIRYMVARDPELSVESTMTIVTDKRPPGRLVEQLLRNPDITKVALS